MDKLHLNSFFDIVFEKRLAKQHFVSEQEITEARKKFEKLAHALETGLDIEVFNDNSSKRILLNTVTEMASDIIRGHQDNTLTESDFWTEKQRLKEVLLNASKTPKLYNNVIRDNFSDLVYKKFGIIGGAFAIAVMSNEEILYLRNKEIQKQITDAYPGMPFIEIPRNYSYTKDYWNADFIDSVKKNRKTLDAISIGNRERLRLVDWEQVPPDFYVNLPGIRDKESESKLLPFERKLTKDGLKVIYCSVGEVLFYLYAWRLLFRNIQQSGLNGKLLENDDVEFEKNYQFWESIKESDLKTPEQDWLKTLEDKFANDEDIQTQWVAMVKELDCAPSKRDGYSFYDEYIRLGLIDDKGHAKREFLSLIQYLIFICKTVLNWKVLSTDLENPNYNFDSPIKTKKELKELLALEEQLSLHFNENISPITLSDLRISQINNIITKVVRSYLLEKYSHRNTNGTKLRDLLEELHKHSRFPIIPHFYELAVGTNHHPKEHLVLCLWESADNQVEIKAITKKETQESGIAFVLLSIMPIWRVSKKMTFIKDDRSIYSYSELSPEAYTRIFRIYDFFQALANPIVDRGFYGNLIKNKIQRETYESDYSNFSHEISKITSNIFDLSNIQMDKLLKGDYLEKVSSLIRQSLANQTNDKDLNVKKWLVIPYPDRFRLWAHILHIWSGRRLERIFPELNSETNALEFLEACNTYAINMYVGSILRSSSPPENYTRIKKYINEFRWLKNEALEKKKMILVEKKDISKLLKSFYIKHSSIETLSFESIGSKGDEALFAQNIFTRLIIACLTNIYEHTTGNFYLNIESHYDIKKGEQLYFEFVNPSSGKIINDENKGTGPVITNCLNLLKGGKYKFRFLDSKLDASVYAKYSNLMKLPQSGKYWITAFNIPISNIFEFE